MNQKILFASLFYLSIFIFYPPKKVQAQQLPAKDLISEYLYLLRTDGKIPINFGGKPDFKDIKYVDTLKNHPWQNRPEPLIKSDSSAAFTLLPYDIKWQNYWQSLEPTNGNDGAIWQGRGFTNALSGGLFMRYKIISLSLRPQIIFNQNRSFQLSPYPVPSGRSKYAYPLGNIDWPQRFGDKSFWSFDAGQSYIRVDYHGWAAGISNETMWWSPAKQNALLLSDNAPGFPHYFISTSEPKNIHIGYLKTTLFWGKLRESDYFDNNPNNNERYITGGRIAFTPKPVPGLRIGINRIYYETIPPEGIPVKDLLKIFEAFTKVKLTSNSNPGGVDKADQLVSLFGSWMFPDSGLEIYGEWARTDYSWNWRDFIMEPEHSRGYTMGLVKVFELPEQRLLSINAELTQLEASKTGIFRGFPTFYVHSRAIQGYTNRGQLLGASIGPGSSSQYLGASLFFNKGKIDLWTQRVALNNDFLYESYSVIEAQNQSKVKPYWLHDIELRTGTSITYFYKHYEAKLGLTLRRELNDHYIYKNDKTHLGLELSIRYRLSDLR